MRRAVLVLALLLAGCAQHPDAPATREVAVSCVDPSTPVAPDAHSPEQLRAIPDGPTLFTMTAADYQALYAWMLRAGPALEGCRRAASP